MEVNGINSASKRIGVVTGANKGLGLEICRQLSIAGVCVILTARDEKKGLEAAKELELSGLSNVDFHQLDVRDSKSIALLAKFIEEKYGKLDILVNNAGIVGLSADWDAMKAFRSKGGNMTDENAELLKEIVKETYEMAQECVVTNYYGTKGVTEALLPLMQLSPSPRIVNLTSSYGQLKWIKNQKAKDELDDVETLTVQKIDKIGETFLRDFKDNRLGESGWPLTASAYRVSKAAINAYTRIIARKLPSFRVNSVHPGRVKTDLSANLGILTPEEGARAPVMLALLPDSGPTGNYFDELEASSF